MASSGSADTNDRRIEFFRRDAFRANSAVWGVRADLNLVVRIMSPGGTEGFLDLLSIAGLAGFRHLRPSVQWPVARDSRWDLSGERPTATPWVEPMEPDPVCGDIPLLTRFSSQPSPRMLAAKGASVWTSFILDDGPVGNLASTTAMVGWIDRDLTTTHATCPGEVGEHGAYVTTPTEVMPHELHVRRSLGFAMNPAAHFTQQPAGRPGVPRHRRPTDGTAAGHRTDRSRGRVRPDHS